MNNRDWMGMGYDIEMRRLEEEESGGDNGGSGCLPLIILIIFIASLISYFSKCGPSQVSFS
jgi:hypothetical protein